jgi:DNA replication protein DnaC
VIQRGFCVFVGAETVGDSGAHTERSTIVSSNLSVKLWGKVLGNEGLTASLVDRLMNRAHVISIKNGRSWRS